MMNSSWLAGSARTKVLWDAVTHLCYVDSEHFVRRNRLTCCNIDSMSALDSFLARAQNLR